MNIQKTYAYTSQYSKYTPNANEIEDTKNHLIFIIGFAIGQILESTTGISVNFRIFVAEQVYQRTDSIKASVIKQ